MHWTDEIHRLLIGVSDIINRLDVDARLLTASDVKLDRALFPLLSRLAMHEPLNTVDLANLVGRDHSTVSRQVAKLEDEGLVERVAVPTDKRARFLKTTAAGQRLLAQIASVRRRWMEEHFSDWSKDDLAQLNLLMTRALQAKDSGPLNQQIGNRTRTDSARKIEKRLPSGKGAA